MTNIFYTAKTGKRNANGHTWTSGKIFKVTRGDSTTRHGLDDLEEIAEYKHQSGGYPMEQTLYDVCRWAGLDGDFSFYKIG